MADKELATLRSRAQAAVFAHSELAIVDHECEHTGKKYRHHYDYNKKYNVHLLCGPCHAKLHHPAKKITIPVMNLNLKNFPEKLRDKLKLEAIKKDTSVKDLIIDILRRYFKPEAKQ